MHLYNRADCCATRLNNFYVLVSATSMDGQSLAQLLSTQGRYVRVHLAGTNQLQLAEVQVMGWPAGAR